MKKKQAWKVLGAVLAGAIVLSDTTPSMVSASVQAVNSQEDKEQKSEQENKKTDRVTVYIDLEKGNDQSDGSTADQAVKTVSRAKEIFDAKKQETENGTDSKTAGSDQENESTAQKQKKDFIKAAAEFFNKVVSKEEEPVILQYLVFVDEKEKDLDRYLETIETAKEKNKENDLLWLLDVNCMTESAYETLLQQEQEASERETAAAPAVTPDVTPIAAPTPEGEPENTPEEKPESTPTPTAAPEEEKPESTPTPTAAPEEEKPESTPTPTTAPEEEKPESTPTPTTAPEEEKPESTPTPTTVPEEEKPESTPTPTTVPEEEKPESTPTPTTAPEEEKPESTPTPTGTPDTDKSEDTSELEQPGQERPEQEEPVDENKWGSVEKTDESDALRDYTVIEKDEDILNWKELLQKSEGQTETDSENTTAQLPENGEDERILAAEEGAQVSADETTDSVEWTVEMEAGVTKIGGSVIVGPDNYGDEKEVVSKPTATPTPTAKPTATPKATTTPKATSSGTKSTGTTKKTQSSTKTTTSIKKQPVKTGDEAMILPFSISTVLSAAMLYLLAFLRMKEKRARSAAAWQTFKKEHPLSGDENE